MELGASFLKFLKAKRTYLISITHIHVHTLKKIKELLLIIGSISRILFSTLSNEDVGYYENKISELDLEQLSITKVTKEQMTSCVPHCRSKFHIRRHCNQRTENKRDPDNNAVTNECNRGQDKQMVFANRSFDCD